MLSNEQVITLATLLSGRAFSVAVHVPEGERSEDLVQLIRSLGFMCMSRVGPMGEEIVVMEQRDGDTRPPRGAAP